MSAMYRVTYDADNRRNSIIMHAADTKSFKAKDVRACFANVRRRAKDRLKKKGVTKPTFVEITCIG